MRKTILILVLAVSATALFSSCASSRGGATGCKLNAGYVGYGSR